MSESADKRPVGRPMLRLGFPLWMAIPVALIAFAMAWLTAMGLAGFAVSLG